MGLLRLEEPVVEEAVPANQAKLCNNIECTSLAYLRVLYCVHMHATLSKDMQVDSAEGRQQMQGENMTKSNGKNVMQSMYARDSVVTPGLVLTV